MAYYYYYYKTCVGLGWVGLGWVGGPVMNRGGGAGAGAGAGAGGGVFVWRVSGGRVFWDRQKS